MSILSIVWQKAVWKTGFRWPFFVATRQYLLHHLKDAYANPSNIILVQENGRVIKETLLTGPQGVVKLETIWDGNRLITGEIYGPTGRFRHGAK